MSRILKPGDPMGIAPQTHPTPEKTVDGGSAIVVGAGLAGLFTALTIARGLGPKPGPKRHVTLLALDVPGKQASSGWAQGGIAAAMGPDDSASNHAQDTEVAGAGIVDPRIAAMVAEEVPRRVEDLFHFGVPFDRSAEGVWSLGREAAHGQNRIVRISGDRAGAVITSTLGQRAQETPAIRIVTGVDVERLIVEQGRVVGVAAAVGADRNPVMIRAPHVVLATGGAGALYSVTTAPLAMLGTGLGLAAQAGARIADPEFVQFHPTAIVLGRDPAPLATEALRGEGAVLTNQAGVRFMPAIHKDAELAPRDVVARAIHGRILAGDHVFLDCRQALGATFPDRFPTVYAHCREAGLDPVKEPIPVAPAAHYHMGGIDVDADGQSSLPGLWACGEVASTGLHGANRLASNSLAEAIVFGGRIGIAIRGATPVMIGDGPADDLIVGDSVTARQTSPGIAHLRSVMTRDVGLIRSRASLVRAASEIKRLARMAPRGRAFDGNVLATATLIVAAAAARTESRGGHFRSDFPQSSPQWAHRTFTSLEEAQSGLDHLAAERHDDGAPLPMSHSHRV